MGRSVRRTAEPSKADGQRTPLGGTVGLRYFLPRGWDPSRWSRRTRAAIAIASVAIFVGAYPAMHATWGSITAALAAIPVVLLAWLYGRLTGTLAGAIAAPANALMLTARGEPGFDIVLGVAGPGSFVLVLIGFVVGTLRDLTARLAAEARARRRVETELAQQSKELHLLLEHSSDLMLVLGLDGTVRYCSPQTERVAGHKPDAIVGSNVFELIHPEDRERVLASFRYGIGHPGELQVNEFRYRHGDGSWRWMESIGNNLWEDGRVSSVVVTLRDTTERRRADEALRSGERAAQQADKLRALGQMAGGIAHNLNQSLALIAGYSELARDKLDGAGGENTRAVRAALETIAKAAHDGGDSLRRILQFGRAPVDGPTESVDLGLLLQEVAQLTAPSWRDEAQAGGRPISLTVETMGDTNVEGRGAHLREAITNLVFNAIDALAEGGNVRLRAMREGDRVAVCVEDDGVGIPEELQARVFEPFFTTKGERGFGLGLAQVFGIVERHAGTVTLDSAAGRGTTVCISLPIGAPKSTPSRETPFAASSAGPLRVLAVDDEPGLTEMISAALTRRGHYVVMASSGEAALREMEAAPFDLVISDLGMGTGMNGWDLAREIHNRWPKVRFILATGWGAQIDPADARSRGVEAVIAKPYRISELERFVSVA